MTHTIRLNGWFAFVLNLALIATAVPAARAATREPARGKQVMVASTHELATAAGVEVLRRGGNAVDAAVAVAFALAVVYPAAGNIGGGGFMLIRLKDGRTTAIDYREMAPAAAHRNMFLDEKGELIPNSSRTGYRAAGVPGTPAGMALALEKYGTIRWAEAIEPARRLAERGFPVDRREELSLQSSKNKLAQFADSNRIFLRNGQLFREGEVLKQPELAATLKRMQKGGPREFYEGQTARSIAADMKANNGLITLDDLRNYTVKERQPLKGMYRGYEIITMPPPSSGGAVLLEMLQILERFDLASYGPGSSQTLHLQTEAMRRAFADRAEFMGDTDFVKVPLAGLVSPKYAASRAATIQLDRASTSEQIGPGAPASYESTETTHFTVVDGEGNVVTNTYTLNLGYGSGVTARGTGVLLNDEMDDFAAKPGTANAFGLIQKEKNAVAPGKRPLSSMTPTIVLKKDGSVWFAVGSPGGPTIINTVMQTIVNVIDFKMNIQQAIDAPRIHHQWLPDEILIEPFMPKDVELGLTTRGHKPTAEFSKFGFNRPWIGDAHAIMIEAETGMRLGASDSRGAGKAMGY